MNTDFDNILRAYIQQVLKIQREKSQHFALTQNELQQIATELGLTEQDWHYIETQFEAFWGRGRQYSKYAQWDEAIKELEQAVLLKPISQEALFDLAQAYKQLWLLRRRTKDKKNAELYAKRCLQLDYKYEAAVKLISELNQPNTQADANTHWLRLALAILSSVALSIFVWLIVRDLFFRQGKPVLPEPQEQVSPLPAKPDNTLRKVKISLEKQLLILGYRLDVESSIFSERNTYIFRGSISHKSKAVQMLQIEALFRNEKKEVIYKKNMLILDEDKPELLQGESLPLTFTANQPLLTQTHEIILQLTTQKLAIESNAEENDFYELTDSLNALKTLGVTIRERNQVIEPMQQSFKHQIILQYENMGANPIKKLEVEIAWFDTEDKLLMNQTIDLLNEQEPMLKPQQKRSREFSFELKTPKKYYKKYYVSIVKME